MQDNCDLIRVGQSFEALVCSTNLTNFNTFWGKRSERKLVEGIQIMATVMTRIIGPSRGTIVKYIGDTSILLFPPDAVDEGVRSLMLLQDEMARKMDEVGCRSRLAVGAHFTSVFGVQLPPMPQPEVLGVAIKMVYRLEQLHGDKLVITPEVFDRLAPETQKMFHSSEPPEVYIAVR